MNESQLIWGASGILFVMIGGIFAMVTTKLDREEYKEHCEDQKKAHEQFWNSINKNNELLARVDERLKKTGD
jgi:hypothetical protein